MDKKKTGRKLKTVEQTRRLLAHVLRQLELHGDVGSLDRAKVILQGAKYLGDLQKDSGIEDRLVRIETALSGLISSPTQKGPGLKLIENLSNAGIKVPPTEN